MRVDVVIPKMGMTMSEGTLVEWLVEDGVAVHVGQPVYVLVTEKVEAEIEAEAAGILRHAVGPNTTLPTGGVVGWIGGAGDERDGMAASIDLVAVAAPNGASRTIASPNARRVARELGIDLTTLRGTGPGHRIVAADVREASATVSSSVAAREAQRAASFVARQLAARLGVDLDSIPVDGNGPITRQDVEAAAAARLGARPQHPALATANTTAAEPERVPLAGMRGVIARRMHESL